MRYEECDDIDEQLALDEARSGEWAETLEWVRKELSVHMEIDMEMELEDFAEDYKYEIKEYLDETL